MRPWHLWALLLVPPALVAGGVGALSHAGLTVASEVVAGLRRRLLRRVVLSTTATEATLQWGRRQISLRPTDALPAAGGLLLAAAWRTPWLSLWALVLGLGASAVLRAARPRVTADLRAEQELFLSALRSRYAVEQSLAAALDGAAADLGDPEGSLVLAAREAVRRLHIGQPLAEALVPLTTQGQTLRSLVTVLSKAPRSASAETETLLEELEESARGKRRLADRARVTLAVVRLTLWILVGANVTAATLGALLPTWHAHYVLRSLCLRRGDRDGAGGLWVLCIQDQGA